MSDWRILWLTLAHRANPDAAPQVALTDQEIALLHRLMPDITREKGPESTLALYIRKLASLGGHLGRSRDPPPGLIVLRRGLSRLADIELGVEIAARPNCGQSQASLEGYVSRDGEEA